MKGVIDPLTQVVLLEECQIMLQDTGFNFDIDEVLGDSRESRINFQRAIIAYYLRMVKGFSFSYIGAVLNRDHSTAIHLINNYGKKTIGRDLKTFWGMRCRVDEVAGAMSMAKDISLIDAQIERLQKRKEGLLKQRV